MDKEYKEERITFEEESSPKIEINPNQDLYPYSIVWTTLPLISALLPWIGHTGIAT